MIRAHVDWVRDTQGTVGIVQLWSALPPATAEALVGELRDTGLYPFRYLIELDRTIARLFGYEDEPLVIELGRHSARRNLGEALAGFQRDDPHEFFEQSARLHGQGQDFGRAVYERVSKTACRLHMVDYPCYSKLYCWSGRGYYYEAAQLNGGGAASVVETACICEGDEKCVFEVRWG